MRLTANRLYPQPPLQSEIAAFAEAKLRELIPAPKPIMNSSQADLSNGKAGHLNPDSAADGHSANAEPSKKVAVSSTAGSQPEEATQKAEASHSEAGNPGGSTAADSKEAGRLNGPEEVTSNCEPQKAAEDGDEERRQSGSLPSGSADISTRSQPPGTLGSGQKASMKGDEVNVSPGEAIGSVEAAQQRCDLFCALCTKNHQLLPLLMEVFGQVRSGPIIKDLPYVLDAVLLFLLTPLSLVLPQGV